MKIAFVFFLFLCAELTSAATFRWVDGNGKVHYGDQPPPSQQTTIDKMSNQGRLVDEQRPVTAEDKAKQAEAEKQAALDLEQKRRDKSLLSSYASVEELDAKRDRTLEQIDGQLKALQFRKTTQDKTLKDLRLDLAKRQKNKKSIPPNLEPQIADLEVLVRNSETDIAARETQRQKVAEQAAADRDRLIELKSLQKKP